MPAKLRRVSGPAALVGVGDYVECERSRAVLTRARSLRRRPRLTRTLVTSACSRAPARVVRWPGPAPLSQRINGTAA